MARIFHGTLLVMTMLLALGGSAMAIPPAGGGTGTFAVFGEYGCDGDYFDQYTGCTIGASYVWSEDLSLAAGYVSYHSDIDSYQGYLLGADLRFGRFLVQANIWYEYDYGTYCKLTGVYLFDLDSLTLGVGGLYFHDFEEDNSAFGLEVQASVRLSGKFALYGSGDYYLNSSDRGMFIYRIGGAFSL